MRKIHIFLLITLCASLLYSCEDYYDTKNDPVTYGDTYQEINIHTGKAIYEPGETVLFSLKEVPPGSPKVRYSYLGEVLKEESLPGKTWSWTAPNEDFKGYLVDIYETINGADTVYQSIAVDVSSDWKKFPRYGFLSSYGQLSESQIQKNIEVLNRYHINGIQFYDWMYDHHHPLAGTAESPLDSWPDLIGRTNYLTTVKGYIDASHQRGIKAMFYNLLFGALQNAAADGVKDEWYIFKDPHQGEKDNHHLDPPFRSSIYLTNPGNTAWQNYLLQRNEDVYRVFPFDGYHIDQLGDRGTVYDYNGEVVKLDETYRSFIAAMKQANPDKSLVMNAVNQYGQQNSIAQSEVDFLYTEVWGPNDSFEELAQIILDNNAFSNQTKNTVLAAYINYARSNSFGYVNMPGVLLANAVIFSFGGAHLELGEHYLSNEYFPNANLQMKAGLKNALVAYYDFLVAYQNLLRDGGTFKPYNVQSADAKLNISNWPSQQGSVSVVGKQFPDRDVIHLINFTNANSLGWRDTNGTQAEPALVENPGLTVSITKPAEKVWMASPDLNGGVAREISFEQAGNELAISLPSLKYWDMIVIEY